MELQPAMENGSTTIGFSSPLREKKIREKPKECVTTNMTVIQIAVNVRSSFKLSRPPK